MSAETKKEICELEQTKSKKERTILEREYTIARNRAGSARNRLTRLRRTFRDADQDDTSIKYYGLAFVDGKAHVTEGANTRQQAFSLGKKLARKLKKGRKGGSSV